MLPYAQTVYVSIDEYVDKKSGKTKVHASENMPCEYKDLLLVSVTASKNAKKTSTSNANPHVVCDFGNTGWNTKIHKIQIQSKSCQVFKWKVKHNESGTKSPSQSEESGKW